MSIRRAYQLLWRTVKLPNIKLMILILLTAKVRCSFFPYFRRLFVYSAFFSYYYSFIVFERYKIRCDSKLNILESKIHHKRRGKYIRLVSPDFQIGYSACDAVTGLKLVEAGIPKEKFALMAVPMIPLQIVLPLFISKYTAGPNPMNVYMKAMPYRLGYARILQMSISTCSLAPFSSVSEYI